jgi:hypothetical protein
VLDLGFGGTAEKAPAIIAEKCHCGDWAGFGFQAPGGNAERWCWEYIIRIRRQHRNATRLRDGRLMEKTPAFVLMAIMILGAAAGFVVSLAHLFG